MDNIDSFVDDNVMDDNVMDDQLTDNPHDGRGRIHTAKPVATLLDSLKGRELQRYAETVIVNVMLKRTDLLELSAWNGIITKNSSNPMISLQEFLDKWSGLHHPLTDAEIIALLSRFGNPYKELQISLQLATESNVNRSYLVSQCFNDYNCKSIKGLCTGMLPSATLMPFSSHIEINQHMMYDFLSFWESIFNLIIIQISRSEKDILQNNLIHEPLKDGIIRTLLRKLGIFGIHSYQIKPILNNALLFSGESVDLTFLDLQSYCRARISYSSNNNGILSDMTKELNSLLEPFSYPSPPLPSTSCKANPKNVLSLFSTLLPDSSGDISSHDFSVLMKKEYPNIQKSFSSALIKCVCNIDKINNNDINIDNYKISVENFQLFCHPNGFSFSVFMLLGSFKIKKSRIKPLDTIDKLYSLAIKQLFLSLRKQRHSDPNLKVPKDLELFLDSNYTKLIPNNNHKTVISFFDNNSKLYGKSDYVNDLYEFDRHLNYKKEMMRKKIESGIIRKEGSLKNTVEDSFINSNKQLKVKKKKNYFSNENNKNVYNNHNEVEVEVEVDSFDNEAINYFHNKNKKLQNNNNDDDIDNDDYHSNSDRKFIDKDNTRRMSSSNQYCNMDSKLNNKTSKGYKPISEKTLHIPPSPLFLGSVNEAHKWGIPMSIKVRDRTSLEDFFFLFLFLRTIFYFFVTFPFSEYCSIYYFFRK